MENARVEGKLQDREGTKETKESTQHEKRVTEKETTGIKTGQKKQTTQGFTQMA